MTYTRRRGAMRANKKFVTTMMVLTVLGMGILMGTLFAGVKWILEQEIMQQAEVEEITKPEDKVKEEVAFNATIQGVIVEKINNQIKVFDRDKDQTVTTVVEMGTKIIDAYGENIPMNVLEVGDVIELMYEPQKDRLIQIAIADGAWTKSDIKNLEIDRSNRIIKIGSKPYTYTEDTLVRDQAGQGINPYMVGDYDTVELKGVEDEVSSIQVTAKQGYLELVDLPVAEGIVEINTRRHVPINQEMQPIPLEEGLHQVVLRLPGYDTLIKTISTKPGETIQITGGEFLKSYATLYVEILNPDLPVQITLGDLTYDGKEPIHIATGTYPIKVEAEGYVTWETQLILEEGSVRLPIELIKEEIEEEVPPTTEENQENTDSEAEETPEGSTDVADYSVNISTEPSDARLTINGEDKGLTPYQTTLEVGEYQIKIEKEGYETYETNILIDHSDNQNSYRYLLIPVE